MSSKSVSDLTSQNTDVLIVQTDPESITPVTLGNHAQDIIDSTYNRTTDNLTPAPRSLTKGALAAEISGSILKDKQWITITDRTDGNPLLVQCHGNNKISPYGWWIKFGQALAVTMDYVNGKNGETNNFIAVFDTDGNLILDSYIGIGTDSPTRPVHIKDNEMTVPGSQIYVNSALTSPGITFGDNPVTDSATNQSVIGMVANDGDFFGGTVLGDLVASAKSTAPRIILGFGASSTTSGVAKTMLTPDGFITGFNSGTIENPLASIHSIGKGNDNTTKNFIAKSLDGTELFNIKNDGEVYVVKKFTFEKDAAQGFTLITDSSGHAKWDSPNIVQNINANPAAMTGVNALLMGLDIPFVTRKTGKVFIAFSAEYTSSTTSDITRINLYSGTGSPPANGTVAFSAPGIAVHQQLNLLASSTTNRLFFAGTAIAIKTVGATYWFDLGIYNAVNGAVQIFNVNVTAIEF